MSVAQEVRLCSVPGCDRPHQARGLCRLHRDRQRKGTPLDAPPLHGGYGRRGDGMAMKDLAQRLDRLGVATDDRSVEFAAFLVVNWPRCVD